MSKDLWESAADVIHAIATPRFGATALGAANRLVHVDHCSLIRIAVGAPAEVIEARSVSPQSQASRATVAYIDHCYRFDPNRLLLRDASRLRGTVLTSRLCAEEVAERTYRVTCWEQPGILDRVSLVTATADGSLVALNFYRERGSDLFSNRDIDQLRGAARFLAAASVRHVELLAHATFDPGVWRQRLRARRPELTARELDVLALMLAGRTLKEAAETLGVAHSSVVTYRERAYARLGVNNAKELRQLFRIR
jgi:DNA-binding CsgD family transcriptional regulator